GNSCSTAPCSTRLCSGYETKPVIESSEFELCDGIAMNRISFTITTTSHAVCLSGCAVPHNKSARDKKEPPAVTEAKPPKPGGLFAMLADVAGRDVDQVWQPDLTSPVS